MKHYDNKDDLIATMKRNKKLADNAVGASWKAHMILSSDVLLREFNFTDEDLQNYIGFMNKRIEENETGVINIHEIEKRILEENSIYFENPNN